ncbi:MAG: hypothetical protein ACRYFX_27350 [Janthinobacterium lividum]
MRNRLLLKPLLAVAALMSISLTPGPTVKKQLAATHMTLMPTPGWTETPLIKNAQMSYDYALRYPGRRLEVRYALRPLATMLAEYARSKHQKNVTMVDPNRMYETLFRAIVLNVGMSNPAGSDPAAGFSKPLQTFPSEAVKAEFGADWGATALIEPGPEFGQTYKHCMLVGLHKNGVADAYCFYLFDDQQDLDDVLFTDSIPSIFHSLRFH